MRNLVNRLGLPAGVPLAALTVVLMGVIIIVCYYFT